MSHYAKGTRFELKTIVDLEANGYDTMRAAGSKGGTKTDVAAFKPGELLLIQCKSDGKLPPGEWDRIVEVAGWVGAIPVLAANGPAGRGVTYTRLLGPKRRGCRTQPCEPFLLDRVAAEPAHIWHTTTLAGMHVEACVHGDAIRRYDDRHKPCRGPAAIGLRTFTRTPLLAPLAAATTSGEAAR